MNLPLTIAKAYTDVSHIYNNLFYLDMKNKVCFSFTPRGGCSVSFQVFLDLIGLLDDALKYHTFIHNYRTQILDNNISNYNINYLISLNYTFIKFITNPYIRAVSIFRAQTSHNLSFREYLKELVSGKVFTYFNDNDKYHLHEQYIPGEENYITKYIRIDQNETFNIKLNNGTIFNIDVNKYSSPHHGIKTNNKTFCGDVLRENLNLVLPISYKFLYDDEIKKLVDTFYKNDIQKYNYNFNDWN